MVKKVKGAIALLVLLILSACQSKSYQMVVVGLKDHDKEEFQKLQQYSLDRIAFDYIADCKVRIKTPDESYSGACSIILTHTLELQISVFNPLGGIILQIYADKEKIQYKNYPEKSYQTFPNTIERKAEIPLIGDVTLAELQSILWGRQVEATKEILEVKYQEDIPHQVTKRQGFFKINIRYQKWMRYQSIDFPKIFEIKNPEKKSSIKFAITNFRPGFAKNLKIRSF